MKEDRRLEVLPIAESVGLLLDRLDLRTQSLRDGIRNSIENVVQDLRQMPLERPGRQASLNHINPHKMEENPVLFRPRPSEEPPQLPKVFLDRPRPRGS